jgi:hypothetical protein
VYWISSRGTKRKFCYEKVGREDIIKPTNGNVSILERSNDNRVRVVNFEH